MPPDIAPTIVSIDTSANRDHAMVAAVLAQHAYQFIFDGKSVFKVTIFSEVGFRAFNRIIEAHRIVGHVVG